MDEVDLAIVGGGVIGAMVAREAVTAFPGATVTVLEQGLTGQGASSRSAGVHFPRGVSPRVKAMTVHSQRVWERLRTELALPIHPVDATVVTSGPAPAAYLALGPETKAPAGAKAWTVPDCHYAEVREVAGRLLGDLRGRVSVREGVRVDKITSADRFDLELGTGDVVRARRVVLAPGPWIGHPAWAARLAPLGLRVKKIVAAHVERRPAPGEPMTVFDEEDAFLLPLPARGNILFSYTCDTWDVTPDDPDLGLTAADLDDARAVLARYAPDLVELCTSGRVFCDTYSENREPVVAELEPGLVFAGAGNGSGYRLAPAIAAQTVEALDLTLTHSTQPEQ